MRNRLHQLGRQKQWEFSHSQVRKLKGKTRDVSQMCSIHGCGKECFLEASGKNASWTHLVSGISHRSLAFLSMKPQSTFFCPYLQVVFLCVWSMPTNLPLQRQQPLVPRLLTLQFGFIITSTSTQSYFFFQKGHICKYQRLKFQRNYREDTVRPITVRCGDLSLKLNFGPFFTMSKT